MNGLDRQLSSTLRIVLLVALCAILYLPPLYRIPFFDKGEPREALEVQYIVTQGQWLFPLKGERDLPSKPPLFHWTGALFSLIWGETNEATVRFPSAFYATLGVLLVYLFGCKLFDSKVAFLAGVILATTFIYQKQAVEARVDMTLTFFVTASLLGFYSLHQGWLPASWGFYGFYFLLGIGVLAKGPVGLILPAATAAIFLIVKKRWDFLARLCFHKGVFLALGIGLSWYGMALFHGGEEFFGRQVLKENLERFFVYGEGGTGHQKPIYYYVPYLFLLGLPWTLLLPFMIMHWWKQRSLAEQSFLFLVLWIAVVFGFFSLAAGKRGVYLLPLYPALALLTARWFQTERELGAIAKIGLRALGGICFLVAVAVAVVFFWSFQGWPLPYMLSAAASPSRAEELKLVVDSILRNQGWTLRVFLGAGVLLWFLVGWELFRLELGRIPLKLSLVSLLSWLSVQMIFVPTLAYARSYGPLMKEVNRVEALGGKVYIYGGGFDSSSLIFYHRGPIPELQDGRLALIERLRFGRDHVLMSEKEWEKIQSAVQNPNLRVVKSGGGPDGDAPLVFISAAVTEPNS